MSETESETDRRLDSAFEELEKKQSVEKPEASSSSGGGAASILAVILSLVAIGVASYPAYEMYREAANPVTTPDYALNSDLTRLRDELSTSDNGLGDVTAMIETLKAEQQASGAALQELRQYARDEIAAVRASLGTSSQDWLMAEVEYLVRMANQRVLMERDPASALQLLESADVILKEAEGLTAHALRQALATDIASLRAVNKVDAQGIYLELGALVNQVSRLKRTLPGYTPAPVIEDIAPTELTLVQRAARFVRSLTERIASLVDFRRGDVEVQPILPPKEEYYLRQNLVLKMQIAQMALLSSNQVVFETSLNEAAAWVESGFDKDSAVTTSMASSLRRLAGQTIEVDLPDISGSLNAVRTSLRDFHEAEPNSP